MSSSGLEVMYRRLIGALGPQRWWPARSAFEMMVGAILTQATAWQNVERAIGRLRRRKALRAEKLLRLSEAALQEAIRPAGYFRQKAARLRGFTRWYVRRYGGSPRRMFRTPWPALREELLARHGIGPETADSMLLYAGRQPVFVVDAYTRRMFQRHRLIDAGASYEAIQTLAMRELPRDVALYNECHALIVAAGKQFCHRRDPACERCPLDDLPHDRLAL